MAVSKSPALPKGWIPMGSHPASYEMGVCRQAFHSGSQSGHIKSIVEDIDGFGTLAQGIDVETFAGHAIKLSAWVKSKDVEEWAGVWMRVDAGRKSVSFDNMQDRPIKGSSDWTKYEITLNVPDDATKIFFGVLLAGTGELWMDDFVIEQLEAPLDGHYGDIYRSCGVRFQVGRATNLDFSQGLRLETQDPSLAAVPVGWFKQDYGKHACKVGVEKALSSGEPSAAFIQSEYKGGHGALLQSVATTEYAGKRVKLSAQLKTSGVDGEAALFYRSDVDRVLSVTYDHMQGRVLKGDNDWAEHACVIDIPADSDNIYIGGTLNGSGTVWFTDYKLEVVSPEIKTTGKFGIQKKTKPAKKKAPKYRNDEPTNLDFSMDDKQVKRVTMPHGWIPSGSAPENFEMGLAPKVVLDGQPVAMLRAKDCNQQNFGTLMQTAGADQYLGKRLRLKAQIKTEDVSWAALWFRIDDANGKIIGFDNMNQKAIKNTTAWSHYECVLDVPKKAANLAFGVLLNGKGTAWFSKVELEVVGDDVETTGSGDESTMDGEPFNLDFELT